MIPIMFNYLSPKEEVLRSQFLPATKNSRICSDAERDIFTLPVKFVPLDLQNIVPVANLETQQLNHKGLNRK